MNMSPKRIMILTNRVPYPLNDGGNMATNAMIYGYQENGWDVFLLSMNTSRHKVDDITLSNIYQDINNFKTVDVDNDVKIFPTLSNYLFSSEPNHVKRFESIQYKNEIKSAINSFNPVIVQVESIYLTQYLGVIKEYSSAKLVLRLHNIENEIWKRLTTSTGQYFKKKYLKSLTERIAEFEHSAWKEYDLLLPITDVDSTHVLNSGLEKEAYVVPFGISEEKIRACNSEEWVAYHIGAMDWLPNKEGIEWFLNEVYPDIRRQIPNFQFHFAGRNMPKTVIGDAQDGILNEGEVIDSDAFIEDKKILIVPLKSGGGIRVKILEAMAAGKVVISTDVGMQGIDAISDKHYIKANSASDFLVSISWLLSNKEQGNAIGKAAKELIVQKYNKKHIAHKLSNRLIELISYQEC